MPDGATDLAKANLRPLHHRGHIANGQRGAVLRFKRHRGDIGGGLEETDLAHIDLLGTLLNEGIGDTIRISVNGDPCDEIMIARQLLSCCKLIDHVPNLIACPTCGRTAWDMQPIVSEIERFLTTVNKDITVAIMGCAVNGPGEARHADIAIAGGKKEGLLIRKGEIIEKIPQDQIAQRLKQEIMEFQPEK